MIPLLIAATLAATPLTKDCDKSVPTCQIAAAAIPPEVEAFNRDRATFCMGVWAMYGPVAEASAGAVIWSAINLKTHPDDATTSNSIVCVKPKTLTSKPYLGVMDAQSDKKK
jgi:hypothetical protein